MPIESAQYIDTLQSDWPLGTDPESAGDDHLRMIKKVLQNTFPKMNAATTMTAAKFNQFDAGWNLAAATTSPAVPAHWQAVNPDTGAMAAIQINSAVGLGMKPADQSYMAVNWSDVINVLMPVGHILMTSKSGNPSTWLGFGTWTERFGYIAASGNVTDTDGVTGSYPLGQGKGYWHPHAEHLWNDTLTLKGTTDSSGAHTHTYTYMGDTGDSGENDSDGTPITKSTTGTTSSNGAHTHPVTVTGAMGIKTLPLILPGFGCYVWERTA